MTKGNFPLKLKGKKKNLKYITQVDTGDSYQASKIVTKLRFWYCLESGEKWCGFKCTELEAVNKTTHKVKAFEIISLKM